ncbi:MAG: ArsR/SmtB family transcription factor, partial [Thermoanaerobaculia bacterium]
MSPRFDENPSPEVLDLIAGRFRALSEPVRLQILMVLSGGEKTVGEIVEATGCK